MKARRTFAATAAMAALLAVGAAPVSADPKSDFTYDMVCESLGTFTVVNFSNGEPSPVLDLGSNRVILPITWESTLYATPYDPNDPPFTREFSYSRGEPQNGRLDNCTFTYEFWNWRGHGLVIGTAVIAYAP